MVMVTRFIMGYVLPRSRPFLPFRLRILKQDSYRELVYLAES